MDQQLNPNPLQSSEEGGEFRSQQPGGFEAVNESQDGSVSTAASFQDFGRPVQSAPQTTEPKSLDELNRLEREYTPEEYQAMAKFYEETLLDFKPGQVVRGRVLAIGAI